MSTFYIFFLRVARRRHSVEAEVTTKKSPVVAALEPFESSSMNIEQYVITVAYPTVVYVQSIFSPRSRQKNPACNRSPTRDSKVP